MSEEVVITNVYIQLLKLSNILPDKVVNFQQTPKLIKSLLDRYHISSMFTMFIENSTAELYKSGCA